MKQLWFKPAPWPCDADVSCVDANTKALQTGYEAREQAKQFRYAGRTHC
jgi:hypothetical protein